MTAKYAFIFFIMAVVAIQQGAAQDDRYTGPIVPVDGNGNQDDESYIQRRDTKDEAEAEMLVAKMLTQAAAEDKAKAESGQSQDDFNSQDDTNFANNNEEGQRRRRFIFGAIRSIFGGLFGRR